MAIGSAEHKPAGAHRIAPPVPNRPPLAANIFRVMEESNCELVPLFPYLHAGAIVPAGAIFRGGDRADYGHFFHSNSVDEVGLVFGSQGGHHSAGQAYALSRVHGVLSPLRNDTDSQSFSVSSITQRQSNAGDQPEAILFRCKKCGEELFRHDFDSTPPADDRDAELPFPGFSTLAGSLAGAEAYNADEAAHTCKACGRVNDSFPVDSWGWKRYVEQNWTINQARRSLDAAAAVLVGEAEH